MFSSGVNFSFRWVVKLYPFLLLKKKKGGGEKSVCIVHISLEINVFEYRYIYLVFFLIKALSLLWQRWWWGMYVCVLLLIGN